MAIGEYAVLTIDKQWAGRPETKWSNTYEFRSLTGVWNPDSTRTMMANFATAEKLLHLNLVEFTQARLSRYKPLTTVPAPDGGITVPYDPEDMIPLALDGTGALDPQGEHVEPKDVILWIRRDTDYGRIGGLEYRGCLLDSDVGSASGGWELVDPAVFEARVALLSPALGAAAAVNDAQLVMIGQPTVSTTKVVVGKRKITTSRSFGDIYTTIVKGFKLDGVRPDKSNHKFFNQTF